MEQQDLNIRPPIDEDVPRLVDLLNACDEVDVGHPDSDVEDAVWPWRLPTFDRQKDAWVVEAAAGEIVAYAMAHEQEAETWVHPEHRGRGIGTQLLHLVEDRALAQSTGEVVLKQNISANQHAARDLLTRAGYEKSHFYTRMEIDIPDPVPDPEFPEGVVLSEFDPATDARRLYDAYCAAWQQYEGQEWEPEGFEIWSIELQGSDFDPSFCLLAERDGNVAGFVLSYSMPNSMGWVGRLGTVPEERGKGIGRALLYAIMRVHRKRGAGRLGLAVSSRNVSSARRLYEGIGMVAVTRYDNMRKTLR